MYNSYKDDSDLLSPTIPTMYLAATMLRKSWMKKEEIDVDRQQKKAFSLEEKIEEGEEF